MTTTTALNPSIGPVPGLLGQVLRPGDHGYDQARSVWNGAIDRRPGFIVRCATSAEIASAVRFAAANGLLLAVKGGGHSIPGWSVCEGGLMIDLSPMKSVAVDPARRLATVEPGVLLREYDAATQAHGLASPGGEISHTGVAGLTLGGGIGWLSRKYGLACDNLIDAEVVLADGSICVANEHQNTELFWALRGGGGNFGVVTRFTFRLHQVPPMYAGFVMYPASQAPQVLAHYERLTREAPEELSLVVALVNAPPAPFVPPQLQLQPVVAMAGIWVGPTAQGERALEAVRCFGNPAVRRQPPGVQRGSSLGRAALGSRRRHAAWANALGNSACRAGAGLNEAVRRQLVVDRAHSRARQSPFGRQGPGRWQGRTGRMRAIEHPRPDFLVQRAAPAAPGVIAHGERRETGTSKTTKTGYFHHATGSRY